MLGLKIPALVATNKATACLFLKKHPVWSPDKQEEMSPQTPVGPTSRTNSQFWLLQTQLEMSHGILKKHNSSCGHLFDRMWPVIMLPTSSSTSCRKSLLKSNVMWMWYATFHLLTFHVNCDTSYISLSTATCTLAASGISKMHTPSNPIDRSDPNGSAFPVSWQVKSAVTE